MNNTARLYFTNYVILGTTLGMYLNLTKNEIVSIENLIFGTSFYFVVLKIMTILLKSFCQYIFQKNTIIAGKSDFKFNIHKLFFGINLVIFIILSIIKYQYIYNFIQTFDAFTSTVCFLIAFIIITVIEINEQVKENINDIYLMQGLDYGTGMAYSYYYGYLKIILPSTGSLNKGIVEKIENIEDIHNIRIPVHKLFILIPSSSYIPPDLKEASYQWMESAMNLENEERNRAGIKKRLYHNSVYKIYPNGQRLHSLPIYVVVEGATPLLTFYEIQKHTHSEANVYKKYCKDIIYKFYEKLKELIYNDPECADLCELIYYDDYDKNGVKINVAKVILDKLYKIQRINDNK